MDDVVVCMRLAKMAQSSILMWFISYAPITFERIVSLWYADTYERRHYPWTVLLGASLQVSLRVCR